MVEMTPALNQFLVGALCLLGAAVLCCLVRAIKGPRFTDRIVALNVICTLVVLLICMLSYVLGEDYLVDVAILYALLNLLAIAMISRITVSRYRQRKEEKQ